jgi:hypothetical protein
MVKIIYAQGWRSKPFKYGRPFVRLEDYEKLKEKIKGDKQ